MAGWGSLGDLKFTLLGGPVEFTDKQSVELAEHAIIGAKPRLQLTGLKPEELSIKIVLHELTTPNPELDLRMMRDSMNTGEVLELVIGEDVSGIYAGKFVIQNLEHTRVEQWPNGKIRRAEATLTLKEWTATPALRQSARKAPPKGIKGKGKATSAAIQTHTETNKDGVPITISGAPK